MKGGWQAAAAAAAWLQLKRSCRWFQVLHSRRQPCMAFALDRQGLRAAPRVEEAML